MRQLPPRARYFVLGTILAGGIITAGIPFLPGGPPQFDFHFLIFLAAALLAQLVGVRFFMPGREGQAWSLISAVLVASIILFSPASNVVLVLITFTAYWIKRRNIPWYQNLWNIAQHEVAVVLAALAWEVVRPIGTSGVEAVHWYAAAVTTGGVFYILNNLQTSTVIALASGRSFRQVGVLSRGNFYRELVLTWMGIIVADMWFDNPWRTVLIIVPLIGLSQMLRSEVEDAERIRRAQVEAEGRAQQLASLNELARGLTSSLEFDQIFDVLYAQLEKTVSPEVLSVALFDGQTNQVEFHVKADEGMLPVVTRPANAPEMRGVLATRTPLVLDPIRNRETVHAMSPHGRLLGSACVTVVPMALAERTVGVILLGTAAPPAGPQRGRMRTRRRGIEEFLGELGLGFFITDVHLARGGVPLSAYRDYYPALRTLSERGQQSFEGDRSPYRPYLVASRGGRGEATAFVRDPESTMQVWSREAGYPGDEWYLEFHKKHFPGGLRYWRVTSSHSDLGAKQPYEPEHATQRIASQADHFAGLLRSVLAGYRDRTNGPGIACSPYDTELFGHWWFEGPRWIQEIFQRLPGTGIAAVDCATYLDRNPPSEAISLQEGSWGEGGDHRVWLNRDTEWTWERLYAVEEEFWALARETVRSSSAVVRRVLAQTARELLLLQASDWQFLITTWAARDYAEARFAEHYANVKRFLQLVRRAAAGTAPQGADEEFLHAREAQNFVFPDIATHLDAAVAAPA